jgi:hypothetical protein
MLAFSETFYTNSSLCLLVIVVEVCALRSGQGSSPGGGDLQLEQSGRKEVACHAQGATQGARHRQARSEREPHQYAEGGKARRLLQ